MIPGAVHSVVVDGGGLLIGSVGIQGGNFEVNVSHPTGVRWRMFVSTTLENFQETDVYVETAMTNETTLIDPWTEALPPRLFVRFEKVM